MMKPFNNYKAEAPVRREILPAGGYCAKILDAKEATYDWGNILLIRFDISEGEYKDFFRRDYEEQTQEDKKWRGALRLRIPKDDGSEQDGWSKKAFGNAMWAVEQSNPGYRWDWAEAGLRGKGVGVLYRNREWEMNGATGWSTECCAFDTVENIRGKKFKQPKDKPLSRARQSAALDAMAEMSDNTVLPF